MRWQVFGAVVSIVLSASAVGATPVGVEHVQTTQFSFTYYYPQTSISVSEDGRAFFGGRLGEFTALYAGETSADMDVLELWLERRGLDPFDMVGETIDLGEIFLRPGNYASIGFPCHFDECGISGSFKVGENLSVTEWEFSTSSTSTGTTSRSQGSELSLSDSVRNADLVQGTTIYDSWYWEPNDSGFSTRPGRWSVSATQACYTTIDGEFHADEACPAPVPLPLSGLALTSAIASFIAIGKGRRWRRWRRTTAEAR